MAETYIFTATAVLFLVWTCSVLWHLRWVRRLPDFPSLTGPGGGALTPGPRCSVVIAARNEEARIEQTVRHVLAQRTVQLELIVVDDRSSDRTPEILRQLATEDARVKVKRVDLLPERWLGKCHACHIGASAATGDWILFTDGDCWLKPEVLARALNVAERLQADHITMTSGLAAGGCGLQAAHLLFLISLSNWFSGVNRDRPKSYMGIGAFNLVRAAAYRESGGYEALRLTVVDDMKLGLLLRRAGKRTRAFLGGDDVECHWGTAAWGTVKIMEKNYFAAIDYRLGVVLAGTVFLIAAIGTLLWGLVSGTMEGLIAAFSPLTIIVPAAVVARRLGRPLWPAAAVPFTLPLLLYSLLNSAWVTLRQGGVRWRGTFYPLETLRSGTVR